MFSSWSSRTLDVAWGKELTDILRDFSGWRPSKWPIFEDMQDLPFALPVGNSEDFLRSGWFPAIVALVVLWLIYRKQGAAAGMVLAGVAIAYTFYLLVPRMDTNDLTGTLIFSGAIGITAMITTYWVFIRGD